MIIALGDSGSALWTHGDVNYGRRNVSDVDVLIGVVR